MAIDKLIKEAAQQIIRDYENDRLMHMDDLPTAFELSSGEFPISVRVYQNDGEVTDIDVTYGHYENEGAWRAISLQGGLEQIEEEIRWGVEEQVSGLENERKTLKDELNKLTAATAKLTSA